MTTPKSKGYLPKDDPIPYSALIYYAITKGLCNESHIGKDGRIPKLAHDLAMILCEKDSMNFSRGVVHHFNSCESTSNPSTNIENGDVSANAIREKNISLSESQNNFKISILMGAGKNSKKYAPQNEECNIPVVDRTIFCETADEMNAFFEEGV